MLSQNYIYKKCLDGTEIQADVYYNPLLSLTTKYSLEPKPIALLIHGGGWSVGTRDEIPKSQIEFLLDLNFVPVTVDYRLCPTINLHDGPMSDVMDALTWCQTKLPQMLQHDANIVADGSKVVAVGWSSGGHLALMLSQAPTPPTAILDYYGVTALTDPYWHTPSPRSKTSIIPSTVTESLTSQIFTELPAPTSSPTALDFSTPRIAWTFDSMRTGTKTMACVGDGNLDRVDPRTWYADPHPESLGGKKFPPVMVLHGDADDVVPLRLSVEMVECIRRQGGTAEIEVLSGRGHGFDMLAKGGDVAKVWPSVRRGYEFLRRYV